MSIVADLVAVAWAILVERIGEEGARRCRESNSLAWQDAQRYARAAITALSQHLVGEMERIRAVSMREDISLAGRIAIIKDISHTALQARASLGEDT